MASTGPLTSGKWHVRGHRRKQVRQSAARAIRNLVDRLNMGQPRPRSVRRYMNEANWPSAGPGACRAVAFCASSRWSPVFARSRPRMRGWPAQRVKGLQDAFSLVLGTGTAHLHRHDRQVMWPQTPAMSAGGAAIKRVVKAIRPSGSSRAPYVMFGPIPSRMVFKRRNTQPPGSAIQLIQQLVGQRADCFVRSGRNKAQTGAIRLMSSPPDFRE